ncbi:hypothetical protein GX586_16025 [bacterium]|nr:hypothetical protein [bacterium]
MRAFRSLDSGGRRAIILRAFSEHGAMTDRVLCAVLGFSDMNAVRPRVTELVHAGQVIEERTVCDEVTGRRVRLCRLAPAQLELAV